MTKSLVVSAAICCILLGGAVEQAQAKGKPCWVNVVICCHPATNWNCDISCQTHDGIYIKYTLTCSGSIGRDGLACARAETGLLYCYSDPIAGACTWSDTESYCRGVYIGGVWLKDVGDIRTKLPDPQTGPLPNTNAGGVCPHHDGRRGCRAPSSEPEGQEQLEPQETFEGS